MARKLVIFGNGLGMALDHQHFSLQSALEDIWNRDDFLTLDQQGLIERSLGRPGAPEGEHELDQLHQAVTYCKALNRIGNGDPHQQFWTPSSVSTITNEVNHDKQEKTYYPFS